MAVWTTPATAVNGGLTAAWLNAEVRDHNVWLKAFADLITNATADDEGSATYMRIYRPNTTDIAYGGGVVGDTIPRWSVAADGTMLWGGGTSSDVGLYREASRILTLDDAQFRSYRVVATNPSFTARIAGDTSDRLAIFPDGMIDMLELAAAPSGAPTNMARLFALDNGAGKTRLMVRFATGTAQQISIEP